MAFYLFFSWNSFEGGNRRLGKGVRGKKGVGGVPESPCYDIHYCTGCARVGGEHNGFHKKMEPQKVSEKINWSLLYEAKYLILREFQGGAIILSPADWNTISPQLQSAEF
jgi:hypothetical protein